MKIAIPANEDRITTCIVFGRCPLFAIYDTESRTTDFITNTASDEQGGAGIKASQVVIDSGAEVLITTRLGKNSAELFNDAGIKIYKAEKENMMENLMLFSKGKLNILDKFHDGYHGLR